MPSNPSAYEPKPTTWFTGSLEYMGRGRAVFSKPRGYVEGEAVASVDGTGVLNVQMKVENFESIRTLDKVMGVAELITGYRAEWTGDMVMMPLSPIMKNTCIKFDISTSEGVFSALEKSGISYSYFGVGDNTIRFYIQLAQFKKADVRQARYWVMPLTNLLAECTQFDSSLDSHPLRMWDMSESGPEVMAKLTEQEKPLLAWSRQMRNRLIIFAINSKKAFIEHVHDYSRLKGNLESGAQRNAITSVMVGERGTKPIAWPNVKAWLPTDLLPLLGLATGIEVGCPWIEFRDGDANLVQRIHANFGRPQFRSGHRAIDEVYEPGTLATLINSFLRSSIYGKAEVRGALREIADCGLYKSDMGESLFRICRGLDILCEFYKLDTQQLDSFIDAGYQSKVRTILGSAAKQIKAITSSTTDPLDKERLNSIASRVTNSAQKDRNFGLAAIELLRLFSLVDAEVMDAHYTKHPRNDNKEWASVVSHYRGVVAHRGYFNLSTKEHDIQDVVRVTTHLYDIFLRIVFKIIDYTGKYRSPLVSNSVDSSWVTVSTHGEDLGY